MRPRRYSPGNLIAGGEKLREYGGKETGPPRPRLSVKACIPCEGQLLTTDYRQAPRRGDAERRDLI